MFNLETAIAVREREDGLLEKDSFNLSTAVPVDESMLAVKPVKQNWELLKDPSFKVDWDLTVQSTKGTIQDIYNSVVNPVMGLFGQKMQPLTTIPNQVDEFFKPRKWNPDNFMEEGVSGELSLAEVAMLGWAAKGAMSFYESSVKTQDFWKSSWADKGETIVAKGGPLAKELAKTELETIRNTVIQNMDKYETMFTSGKNFQEGLSVEQKADTILGRVFKDPINYKDLGRDIIKESELKWQGIKVNLVIDVEGKVIQEQKGSIFDTFKRGLVNQRGSTIAPFMPNNGDKVSFKGRPGKVIINDEFKYPRVGVEFFDEQGRIAVVMANQLSLPKVSQPTEGKVIKAYHGTGTEFDEFDLSKAKSSSGSQTAGVGIWFTSDKNVAKEFADWSSFGGNKGKPIIKEADLNMKNPKIYESSEGWDSFQRYRVDLEKFKTKKSSHIKILRSMTEADPELGMTDFGGKKLAEISLNMVDDVFDYKGFRDSLIKQGYDGIILKNSLVDAVGETLPSGKVINQKPHDQYLVFDKSQIKLSTPTGEGQKPPVEPPKTAVSGEPTPDGDKLFKDYVRATPVGKVISKSANIKQEIANEDFLIKSYEGDISKLEQQIKVEQFNTEVEKLKAQDKLVALKDKYALAKETQRQKKSYRDEVAGLVKSITATPKENIAIEYQDMIEQLQSKFDLKRRTEATEAKRESMKAFVERMKIEGKPIDIPAEKLAMLDKVTLNDMTLDQLREIKKTIDDLTKLGKTKLKAREAVYATTKENAKTELLETATPINSKELAKLPIGEKHNAWIKKAIEIQNAAQKTGVGLTPIDGLADVTGMGKMKDVLDKDFSKYLTHNDKAIDEWYKLTKDFTEKEFERIGVVAASRQEGGLERLANSNITEEEVKAIKLTPAEEKAYKFVIDAFDKEYPAVKQYSKEVYNTDVGQQENYVSFMSDYEQMSDLEIYQRFGQTPEQVATKRTKTVEQGFTKERAGVSKIKLETNIDKIFRRHLDDVAYMLNTGKNIKMYFEIINSPEMREKLGDVGTLAWLQYLDLMARKGGSEGGKRIAILDILRKNIGAGVLSFRLSSALVQFSSFADTIATIGIEWATKGATAISNKEWRNFIMDNFPEIKKAVGDDIAFREFGEGALARLANAGLKPLQFLDGLMRSTAAAGSYQKLAAEKGIAIDLNNPNAELVAEATKLMRNSQGSSFFKDQPLAITAGYGLTDNRSVNKLLLTFQSFMLNRWDNINRQIWRMGIKEKDYGKAISSVFWLLIFAGAVEEGIRRGSRKIIQAFAKDKRKEDNFIQGTLLNIIQSVPIAGQLVSAITYSSNPVPVINTFDDLLEGIGAITKGKEVETKAKGVVKTLGAAGSLIGLAGSSQVAQIIKGIIPKAEKGLSSGSRLKSGSKLKSGSRLR